MVTVAWHAASKSGGWPRSKVYVCKEPLWVVSPLHDLLYRHLPQRCFDGTRAEGSFKVWAFGFWGHQSTFRGYASKAILEIVGQESFKVWASGFWRHQSTFRRYASKAIFEVVGQLRKAPGAALVTSVARRSCSKCVGSALNLQCSHCSLITTET